MDNKVVNDDDLAKNLFNEMCYEIIIAHKKKDQYMELLKNMLMRPVAIFGKDISWTFGNEGRNEFIRSMINGAHHHMNKKPTDTKVKKTIRTKGDK